MIYSNTDLRSEAGCPELQKTIQRQRSAAKPTAGSKLPNRCKSIWHFARFMEENPQELVYEGKDGVKHELKGKLIKSSSKTYHYLMYDEKLMAEFTDNETFWDGTFDSRPRVKNVNQFFTIMGQKAGVVSYSNEICFYLLFLSLKNWSRHSRLIRH